MDAALFSGSRPHLRRAHDPAVPLPASSLQIIQLHQSYAGGAAGPADNCRIVAGRQRLDQGRFGVLIRLEADRFKLSPRRVSRRRRSQSSRPEPVLTREKVAREAEASHSLHKGDNEDAEPRADERKMDTGV